MTVNYRTATWLLALAGALACTDDVLDGGNDSGGDFAITVGAGAQPTYSWGAGPAFSVDVVRSSNQTVVVWRIANPNTRNIASPVRHGTVPSGAFETIAIERVLTAGIRYRVTITLSDGRAAFQEFVP
jgi:hypothetical protein